MFEDTPEFVARHIIREAKQLPRRPGAAVLPRAGGLRAGRLVLVALPGPLGRRGVPQEPGGPDVPPVLRREHAARRRLQLGRGARPAARPHRPGGRQREATRRASSTPTTASSSPTAPAPATRWCGTTRWRRATWWWSTATATSRILHSIIMTGAVPVFLTPTRNHLGIIGPIPRARVRARDDPPAHRRQPAAGRRRTPAEVKPRILTITQSTYDGVLYNVETRSRPCSTAGSTRCTSTRPGCRTPPSTTFYSGMHAIGKDRPRTKDAMVFATQSTHKLLAGCRQASQMLVAGLAEPRRSTSTCSTRPT